MTTRQGATDVCRSTNEEDVMTGHRDARVISAEAASLLEGYVRKYRRERSPIRADLARLWTELLPLGVVPSRGSGLSLHDEASAGVASL